MLTSQSIKEALNAATYFDFNSCLILKISGADATRYLHGRLTQNIKSLENFQTAKSLVLTAQGKIQGKFTILKDQDSFLIISDPLSTKEEREDFVRAILQFKVSDDVKIEELNNSYRLIKVLGQKAKESLGKSFATTLANNKFSKLENGIIIAENFPFFDLLYPTNLQAEICDKLDRVGVKSCELELFEALRICYKIPRMKLDLDEKVVATEIDITDLVSFDKGCYAGQEVVEMSTARGRPNRKLVLLKAQTIKEINRGEEILTTAENKPCGHISSTFFLKSEKLAISLGFIKSSLLEEKFFKTKDCELERIDSFL